MTENTPAITIAGRSAGILMLRMIRRALAPSICAA